MDGPGNAFHRRTIVKTVPVNLGKRSYQIHIGEAVLSETGALVAKVTAPTKALIVTDENVGELYGEAVRGSLEQAGVPCVTATVPPGETSKSLAMASRLYDDFAGAGADRKSVVVALGGGVVGDLAGFAAATYMRGIPYVQIPTTLLADVDSSVGGKVAVNHSAGKNMIGAFYQPRLVLVDIETLGTLPEEDFNAGMVEVIKYGIIADGEFFGYLQEKGDALRRLEPDVVSDVVERCCRIKAQVVEQDETESGRRAILNYGHTIGHALEKLSRYSDYRHGEAVAVGTVAACRLSEAIERFSAGDTERVIKLLEFFGEPTAVAGALNADQVLATMRLDKKAVAGQLRFVLARTLGEVVIRADVPDQEVVRVLREIGCG